MLLTADPIFARYGIDLIGLTRSRLTAITKLSGSEIANTAQRMLRPGKSGVVNESPFYSLAAQEALP